MLRGRRPFVSVYLDTSAGDYREAAKNGSFIGALLPAGIGIRHRGWTKFKGRGERSGDERQSAAALLGLKPATSQNPSRRCPVASPARDTPIIFLSAFQDEAIRASAIKAGAVCFLSKPVDGQILVECLDRALNKRQ